MQSPISLSRVHPMPEYGPNTFLTTGCFASMYVVPPSEVNVANEQFWCGRRDPCNHN